MAILNQKKILNVIPGISPQLTVHCSQSDEGSTVEFELFAGSVPFEPDGTASVQGIRKDGTGFGPEVVALDGSTATVTLSTAMTGAAGPALCEITITETGGSVSTANFALLVEEAAFPNGPLVDNSVDVYQQILQYVQSFPAAAAADATAKVAAEAAARQAADQALQASINAEVTARAAAVSAEATARAAADTQLQTEISGLQNAVGGPNVALTAADFTDITKVYVVAGTIPGMTTGDWYYWDGTQWVSGGVYNSTAVQTDPTLSVAGMPADAAACGDLKSALQNVTNRTAIASLKALVTEAGGIKYADGANNNASAYLTGYTRSDYIAVSKGDRVAFTGVRTTDTSATVAVYDANKNYIQAQSIVGTNLAESDDVVLEQFGYIRLSCRNAELTNATFTVQNTFGLKFDSLSKNADALRTNGAKTNFLTLDVAEAVKNKNKLINADTGAVEDTVSAIGVSDFLACNQGDKLTYTLSNETDKVILATYDGDFNFLRSPVVGTGSSKYITGDYTFKSDEKYFCISGKTGDAYTQNYSVAYSTTVTVISAMEAQLADLDDRVTALDNQLPAVWQTYLTTKKTAIKSALVDIGDTGESFVFVTDCHIPRNNMLTPRIIQMLNPDCPVNYYINGGDFLDMDTDSAQGAIDDLWSWKDAMHGIVEFCMRGNHDNNNFNGTNAANAITVGQFYAVMERQIENIVDTAGKTYYCIDNDSQKIRIIVLDTSLSNPAKTAMYAWMAERMTELDSGWTLLVMQHYLWGSTTEAISTPGQATIDAINAAYSQINAEFIGILAGHTHTDYNDTESVNGYLLIARDTNMISGGTGTNSLSFDYVTINTSTKKINFTKVGRGSDLSLSY